MINTELLPRDEWKLEVVERPDDGRLLLIVRARAQINYRNWYCDKMAFLSQYRHENRNNTIHPYEV